MAEYTSDPEQLFTDNQLWQQTESATDMLCQVTEISANPLFRKASMFAMFLSLLSQAEDSIEGMRDTRT